MLQGKLLVHKASIVWGRGGTLNIVGGQGGGGRYQSRRATAAEARSATAA
jgi:hypothetical protein